MKNLNPEMIEKAKAAKSAEELLEIAKANGVDLTPDEAAAYFVQLNPKSGELDDDDLDTVAGGACSDQKNIDLFPIGSKVRRLSGPCSCGCNVWTIESDSIAHSGGSVRAIAPRCDNCRIKEDAKRLTSTSMVGEWELI